MRIGRSAAFIDRAEADSFQVGTCMRVYLGAPTKAAGGAGFIPAALLDSGMAGMNPALPTENHIG